jgi:hypothetical protein
LDLFDHEVSDEFAVGFFVVVHESVCGGVHFYDDLAAVASFEHVQGEDVVCSLEQSAASGGPELVARLDGQQRELHVAGVVLPRVAAAPKTTHMRTNNLHAIFILVRNKRLFLII